MPDEKAFADQYPLLASLLLARGMATKPIWHHDDLAQIFGVSVRTIQEWESDPEKDFPPRDLPGGAAQLSGDLEEFLRKSGHRKPRRRRKLAGDGGSRQPLWPEKEKRKKRKAKPGEGGEPSVDNHTSK
jgi:hypothetical protein